MLRAFSVSDVLMKSQLIDFFNIFLNIIYMSSPAVHLEHCERLNRKTGCNIPDMLCVLWVFNSLLLVRFLSSFYPLDLQHPRYYIVR